MKIPVLIVSYKRYANVLAILRTLNENDCGRIYLAVDGLKRPDNGERQIFMKDVASLAESLNLEIEVWYRDRNLGAAVSVVNGVDWLFSREQQGLILEDDLLIGTDTLNYFENALTYYEHDINVHLISGSNYWAKRFSSLKNPWSSYPITWGWATWKNRWTSLRRCYFSTDRYSHKGSSLSETFFWRTGVSRCKNGEQDAWDIPLAAFSRGQDGISILPPVNLISNIGVDAHAGNTRENIWPLNHPISRMPDHFRFTSPSNLTSAECLDLPIRKELYQISFRNIATGALRVTLDKVSETRRSKSDQLGTRINSVILPL